MPNHYSSREIAAHLAQVSMDKSKEADFVQDFIKTLQGRVPAIKRGGDRKQYEDLSSLLYCVKDLKGSSRNVGLNIGFKDEEGSHRNLNRAARRVREIGELLIEIRGNYPEEYERSCKSFTSKWRETEFTKGEKILDLLDGPDREQGMREQEEPEAAPEKAEASGPVL